jgi:hypothetical protein
MVSPIKDKRDGLSWLACQTFTHKLGPTWPVVKTFGTCGESMGRDLWLVSGMVMWLVAWHISAEVVAAGPTFTFLTP